jgi:hypothetical protein
MIFRWISLIALTSFQVISFTAQAEYRAFLLELRDANQQPIRQWVSTLDPDQYRDFHQVSRDLYLDYTQTWMCPGRTNELPLCPPPAVEMEPPPSDQNQAPPP